MSVYVIAQGRIENREMLDEYVGKALPTIQAAGAATARARRIGPEQARLPRPTGGDPHGR